MRDRSSADRLQAYIKSEIEQARTLQEKNEFGEAFRHLERAHVLGQSITAEHTRVHWLMLKCGWRSKDWREVFGQLFRIIGAATKTPFAIYPSGNTGGANVSPFRSMPIPDDLRMMMEQARRGE